MIPFGLDTEARSASAGRLHRSVLELETGGLERLHIINSTVDQVHRGGGVNKDLQIVELVNLVHHSSLVLERHRVLEAGAAAADHTDAEARRNRILSSHNLLHLGDRRGGE